MHKEEKISDFLLFHSQYTSISGERKMLKTEIGCMYCIDMTEKQHWPNRKDKLPPADVFSEHLPRQFLCPIGCPSWDAQWRP